MTLHDRGETGFYRKFVFNKSITIAVKRNYNFHRYSYIYIEILGMGVLEESTLTITPPTRLTHICVLGAWINVFISFTIFRLYFGIFVFFIALLQYLIQQNYFRMFKTVRKIKLLRRHKLTKI